jgi:hypothetical protein
MTAAAGQAALAEADQSPGLGVPGPGRCGVQADGHRPAYYARHGYVETHRAEQHGFHRVLFRKPID